jgi:hypothetical protein
MEREAHYDVADQPADFKRHPNVSYSTAFCWFFLKVIECSSWSWSYVVGFTTTCAISAYHHYSCEFNPIHGDVYSIQHYVIKFVGDLPQVGGFLRVLRLPPPIKLTTTI